MADIFDLGFNANEVEPAKERGVLPHGNYEVVLVASERKPNSKGTGEILSLDFQVINGPFQNRHVFANLNIRNNSKEAEQIAWAELSALCRAVEVMSPKDTAELHNKPLIVSLNVKDDEQRGKQNRITGYKHRNAGRPQPPPINAQPAAAHQFTQQAAPQQLDPFGHGPTPPPPSGGVYQQPQPVTATGSGKAWG